MRNGEVVTTEAVTARVCLPVDPQYRGAATTEAGKRPSKNYLNVMTDAGLGNVVKVNEEFDKKYRELAALLRAKDYGGARARTPELFELAYFPGELTNARYLRASAAFGQQDFAAAWPDFVAISSGAIVCPATRSACGGTHAERHERAGSDRSGRFRV
jgi:hypothetical protein